MILHFFFLIKQSSKKYGTSELFDHIQITVRIWSIHKLLYSNINYKYEYSHNLMSLFPIRLCCALSLVLTVTLNNWLFKKFKPYVLIIFSSSILKAILNTWKCENIQLWHCKINTVSVSLSSKFSHCPKHQNHFRLSQVTVSACIFPLHYPQKRLSLFVYETNKLIIHKKLRWKAKLQQAVYKETTLYSFRQKNLSTCLWSWEG